MNAEKIRMALRTYISFNHIYTIEEEEILVKHLLMEIEDENRAFAIQELEKVKGFAERSYCNEIVYYCKELIEKRANEMTL